MISIKINNMKEISNRIIEILVLKKTLMSKYITESLTHQQSMETSSMIFEYGDKMQTFLKECDDTDFKSALINHQEFVGNAIMDVINYYNREMKNCAISEIIRYLQEKEKEAHSLYVEFDNHINS